MEVIRITPQIVFNEIQHTVSYQEGVLYALQLLAWSKLSREKKIDSDLRLKETLHPLTYEKVEKAFLKLEKYNQGFKVSIRQRENAQKEVVSLRTLQELSGAVSDGFVLDYVSTFSIIERQQFIESPLFEVIPECVVKLMASLLTKNTLDKVYCPFDMALSFARAHNDIKPYLEVHSRFVVPYLMSILCDVEADLRPGQPIIEPQFLNNGTLRKFPHSLAFLVMENFHYGMDFRNDPFGRFPENTSRSTILHIRHILAQTSDTAVIAVPDNILFSPGYEAMLRKDLIDQGKVKCVISLPSLLLPNTALAFSLLVIDVNGGHRSVRFISAREDECTRKIRKNRNLLVSWESITTRYYSEVPLAQVQDISVELIQAEGYTLTVSRYVNAASGEKVQELIGDSRTVPLQSLVTFVRSKVKMQTKGKSEFTVRVGEVGAGDIPEFGYLKRVKKEVSANADLVEEFKESFLHENDILLVTKGPVGKVALLSNKTPLPGVDGWIASQVITVLRPLQGVDPISLFVYLRSELGQTLLKRITSGATMPLIQLKALKELEVVVPSKNEIKDIRAMFMTQESKEQQVEMLREEQRELGRKFWKLDDSSS